MTAPAATAERRASWLIAGLVAAAALLPFLPGLLAGRALYFRDLSVYFFPLRRFVAEGLQAGHLRFWNPLVHEGEPVLLPPVGYPPDLLQALWPDERFFSLLLALHLTLGAVGTFALARSLGLVRSASAVAGLVYALGGFALSSVNLYVYAEAMGWAPLAVLGLQAVAESGRRALPLAVLPLALCFSSTGLEVALQTVLVALVLVRRPRSLALPLAAVALAMGVAAFPLLVVSGSMAGSVRAAGFTTDVVLAHSIHPLTLVQTAVASFHGDLGHLADRWWGQNFFPRGFPYVLSLYLGPPVMALALVGALRGGPRGRRLAALAALAVLVCLGRWLFWGALLDRVPQFRVVRYPAKAFFTVHFCAALLAGLGLDGAWRAGRRGWWVLGAVAGAAAAMLLALPLLPAVAPRWTAWFAAGFFPPGEPWPQRLEQLRFVAHDAARGGAMAALLAAGALLAARARLAPRTAAWLAVLIAGADLVRAGAGLNPMLPVDALRPGPEAQAIAASARAAGGRVFTCDVATSPAYLAARVRRAENHARWTLEALADTLTPGFNMGASVPTAYSSDLTMLVPGQRVLAEGEGCPGVGALVERFERARITHVLSLDPLQDPRLVLAGRAAPARLAPLEVYVYALPAPRPRFEVTAPDGTAAVEATIASVAETTDGLDLLVETAAAGRLVVRDAAGAGWRARVNGVPAPVATAEGRYRALAVPAGRSTVALRYAPPGWRLGVGLSAAGLLTVLMAARRR